METQTMNYQGMFYGQAMDAPWRAKTSAFEADIRVLQTECSLNWGGQEKRSVEEVEWLRQHGCNAWLACNPNSAIFLKRAEFGSTGRYIVPFDFSKSWKLNTTLALARFIRQHHIDIIHVHGSRDSWIAFPLHLLSFPVVRSKHIQLGNTVSWKKTFLFRWGCSQVIATAEAIRKNLVHNVRLPQSRVDLVGEGVDLKKFKPVCSGLNFRRQLGVSPKTPLIGVVGMIRGEKGHMTFIQAAFKVLLKEPGARFAIIGEGIGKKTHEEKCRAAVTDGLKSIPKKSELEPIVFMGYCHNVAEAIAALDIIVVPSYSEGQTKVIPEAFASQRSVIASNAGGIPELVQHNVNGILVPPGDADALAQAILDLIASPEKRNRLALGGLETAQKQLSFDRKMEALLEVYGKVLERHQ